MWLSCASVKARLRLIIEANGGHSEIQSAHYILKTLPKSFIEAFFHSHSDIIFIRVFRWVNLSGPPCTVDRKLWENPKYCQAKSFKRETRKQTSRQGPTQDNVPQRHIPSQCLPLSNTGLRCDINQFPGNDHDSMAQQKLRAPNGCTRTCFFPEKLPNRKKFSCRLE